VTPGSAVARGARVRRAQGVPTFSRRAVAALFLERQHLTRPRAVKLNGPRLVRFVADAGGLQIDSINVVERAHYLTVWSRFGAYDRRALDRLVERRRLLFEYWAHAACFVPRDDLPAWRCAMADYQLRHTGWARWLKRNAKAVREVEAEIARRGPTANADFREQRPAGGAGWWNWKPATHALHVLWMTGRILVHSRRHFHKRFDLAARVLPEIDQVAPLDTEAFVRWHLRRSLRAMGAATETDLRMYLTFPRMPAGGRRAALRALLESGEIVEIAVEGDARRWLARREDFESLAAAGRRRAASRGTTLLSPFDSLLWHRERARTLFGYDYRIEVYTPSPKRTHGYYSLPILHDGLLVGRLDAKNHRANAELVLRRIHLEPWLERGAAPPAAAWSTPDPDAVLAGTADALRSLATFVGATQVTVARGASSRWRAPLARRLES
jgi:uncharacterized protein